MGKPVTMTVDELKQVLATRADKFKSLLVEYDLVTEALVEPRLLMSWDLHHVRDWQERHRIAFAGDKRFTQIERAAVMPLYAPPDRVDADSDAPRSVAVVIERERKNAMSRKEKGSSSYLFAATRAEKLASIFDGRNCFLWSAQANRMMPAHDAGAYHSPLMYLAGLGLRPIDPVSSANAERRKWQRQFWFPENFAVYETCRILPSEEYVDEAALP